jgi:mRNA-degrading endonuclease RelE of RelBE toxin-antitoxin system
MYNIKVTSLFEKEFKKLTKRYKSAREDIQAVVQSIIINPTQGIYIGNNCYKIKVAIKSKNKGKSGGARLITRILISESSIYLLSIYDKSDKDNISDKEIDNLLKGL